VRSRKPGPQVAASCEYRVLVADSDAVFAADFAGALCGRGFAALHVCNGYDMQAQIERSVASETGAAPFDVVVCEARLSGKTGLEVYADLRKRGVAPPFIFVAARLDRFAHQQARRLRAIGIIAKPIDLDGLTVFVQSTVI
jgi:DNA-binding response OmpR family regulator